MKLAKLLAAGAGLLTSGGAVRYRENKNVYLPKFESAKTALVRPAPTPAPAAPQPSAAPAKAAAPVLARPALIRPAAAKPARRNPLARLLGGAGPAARPARAEQTELLLDAVRVVSSDLTDVKVDVPPTKSRPARKKAVEPALAGWGEMGNSVLEPNLV